MVKSVAGIAALFFDTYYWTSVLQEETVCLSLDVLVFTDQANDDSGERSL